MRPYQAILIGVTILLVAAIVGFLLYGDRGKSITSIGGPFQLIDQTGHKRTSKSFYGRFSLVYFGYTFCPDVCPTALQVMTQAINQLDEKTQSKITPVFITIDPERDTVKQLKSYVENFHPRLVGLTGSKEQIAKAARAFRVYYSKSKDDSGSSSEYLMDHSSIVFLMDPEGSYVTHFTHSTTIENVVQILKNRLGGDK